MAANGFLGRHENIYFYVPNLIGYFRIVCSLAAFTVALDHPTFCAAAYLTGFLCDAFDGWCARRFQQTSQFGTVLDMVTDRLSTTGLLVIVSILHHDLYVYCLGLLLLDIFSHWSEMYFSLASGAKSHKDIESRFWILRAYYKSRMLMGFCCLCCEVLYLMLYLLKWPAYHWLLQHMRLPNKILQLIKLTGTEIDAGPLALAFSALCLTGVCFKQVVNVMQLGISLDGLVQLELKKQKRNL